MRSLPRLALAAAIGLASAAESAPARADWISLSGPTKPGEVDGWTWVVASGLSLGALVPQGFAAGEFASGENALKRGDGVGIFAGGLVASGLDLVLLAYSRSNPEATLGALMGGPFFSMMGVGLGRTISLAPHSTWLGGSMGFTTFALTHGIMASAGVSDSPGANVFQAIWATAGGAGCFVDAAYSLGAERWTAVGCGVVATAAFVHGVVKAARGDTSYHKKPAHHALVPVPWVTREVTGLTLAGSF
jgi:hypothetical protein